MSRYANPKFAIIAATLLALLMVGGAAIYTSRKAAPATAASEPARPAGMRAGAFDPPRAAPDFALPGSDGSQVTLARYRGKVVLLSFGFTYCAAVCPTTLSTLARARAKLGKQAGQVQVIFVTVDPERDDAAHMAKYLTGFDPSFIGATGTPEALAGVRKLYGVAAEKQGGGRDYAVAHTSSIFLIDREGRLRAMMPFGHDPDDFVNDIRLLLA